jgi:outer membrane usher protein FimD/PapC
MTNRLSVVCLSVALALLLSAASARAAQDNAADPECLKGTVAKVADTALFLKGTSFPDETLGKRDAMVLLDKDTTYYDGAKKVNKAALQPGHLVLVRCRMAGKDRAAILVRIIGGKKL